MKKKKAVAMIKNKHNNSIMKLGRNTFLALNKKVKKTRNEQLSSVYNTNATFMDKNRDNLSLYSSLNNTTINPNAKIIRNITRSIKNYKPPRSKATSLEKKNRLIDKRNSMAGAETHNSLADYVRPITPHWIKKLTSIIEDGNSLDKNKANSMMFKTIHSVTPKNFHDIRLSRNKTNYTNFCLYQSLTGNRTKSKTRNTKLAQKSLFHPKKSRNYMTLDGMNSSSMDVLKKSYEKGNFKMIPAKKIKSFHSKIHSETPKKNRKKLDPDQISTMKKNIGRESYSQDKKTIATKERGVGNIFKETIEATLNNRIWILEKDLKKKRIEYIDIIQVSSFPLLILKSNFIIETKHRRI
jgi:hypothetical protein